MTARLAWLIVAFFVVSLASFGASAQWVQPATEVTAAALLAQSEKLSTLLEGVLWAVMCCITFFGYSVGARE